MVLSHPIRVMMHLVIMVTLLGASAAATAQQVAAQNTSTYDMVMVASTGACVTVLDSEPDGAGIGTRACRGTDAQYWRIDENGYWHTKLDDTFCIAHSSGTSSTLAMASCSDPRAIPTTERTDISTGYVKTGTTQAFDVASWAELTLYAQHTGSNQRFNWLQPSLEYLTTYADHDVSYPLALEDTLSYEIELVRDQIAKIQPPFAIPSSARRPTTFPGPVGQDAQWVTKDYTFDLNFRDHSYLRMSFPPRNWMSTGLYAPPGQVITVTVSDASAEAMRHVYVQLGSSTDTLSPGSGNVVGSGHFKRPPSVAFSVKLEPGENLIRTPYGGPVILRSNESFADSIQVSVSAVQAPYFKLGQTTEADWLAVRNSPVPMGELESNRFVVHVMADQLAERTYDEMVAVAQSYDRIADLTDELAGLSPTAALPHTSPMGKQRISQDIHIAAGWGHSGFPIQVYPEWPLVDPGTMVTRSSDIAWGVWHELGHNYQMGAWSYVMGTEVTVNWWSLYNQQHMFGDSRVINYGFYPDMLTLLRDSSVTDKWGAGDAGQQLALFDQLRILHPTLDWQLYTRIIRAYREKSASAYSALQTDAQKRDEFIRLFCEVSGSNAVPHFAAWNLTVTNATRTYCATKRALPARSWLIDGSVSRHSGKGKNTMLLEQWTGVGSSGLISLTADTAFPTVPGSSAVVTGSFELANNSRDNDARRVRAWLHPPVSGPYRFWLSGDDQAELLLSTGADASGARTILRIEEATAQRGFDDIGVSVQRSEVITLTANKRYYIELRQTDVNGGDHASVAWEIPAGAGVVAETRRPIEGKFLSAFTGDIAVTLSRQPNSTAAVRPGSTTTVKLTVKNNSTMPISSTAVMLTLPDGFTIAAADAAAWQSGWRYVKIESLAEANGGVHTSAREFEVLTNDGAAIDRSNWRIHGVSSEETVCDGDAAHAIDGDFETIWHTNWCGAGPGVFPHWIAIDMGEIQTVTGVRYTPRNPGANGNIGQYRISVSADGNSWTRVTQGTWDDNGEVQTVTFTAPQSPYQRVIDTRIAPNRTAAVSVRLTARSNLAPRRYSINARIRAAYDDGGAVFETNARNNASVLNITVNRRGRR